MLDEEKQIALGKIIPYGTDSTDLQREIRTEISGQQRKLTKINSSDMISASFQYLDDAELMISKFFKKHNVLSFGFTELIEQYTYQNSCITPSEKSVIVFALAMDYEKMQSVPSIESATEILNVYAKVGHIVLELTKFLRQKGIQASGHHPLGDSSDYHHLLMPPFAVAAGLGEKGRTGLFIDHKLGPMVRLGVVTTSLVLNYNEPINRGINAFCHRCRFCVPHCPPRALPEDKYLESLEMRTPMKFEINGEKCLKYFTKHYGCGKCIVKCVLAQPDQIEIEKRMKRIEIWYNRWVVSGELESLHQDHLKVSTNDV